MENLIESISSFIGKTVTVLLISGSVCLLAGEIRLAALKKATQGSAKLSTFTAKMTKNSI